jgi:hypothetical protein
MMLVLRDKAFCAIEKKKEEKKIKTIMASLISCELAED